MDFGGLVVMGVLWLLFNLVSRGKSAGGREPKPRPMPGVSDEGDATQREGSKLEQFLRELERNLEQAGGTGRAPSPGRPAPAKARPQVVVLPQPSEEEDVEETGSLEEPEQVVSLETEPVRRVRPEYDQDTDAEALVRKRIAAAEARGGPLTKAGHKEFDARIRQEPGDHTAVRRYTTAQLRDAVVWREILGPPVSEREP